MSDQIKIILADDEALFRQGIAFILQREKNFEILFEASDGAELIEYLNRNEQLLPDIILMDLKMPMLNGVEATKLIHRQYPQIRVIALTSYDSKPFIANMVQVGAASYLVKNATPKEMVFTIKEVMNKGFYYNDFVMQVVNENMIQEQKKSKTNFDDDYLTNREIEILRLICSQMSTNEIADKLFISPRTVEGHRNNLLLKTDSKNVAGLVVYAIQNKIISLDSLSLR